MSHRPRLPAIRYAPAAVAQLTPAQQAANAAAVKELKELAEQKADENEDANAVYFGLIISNQQSATSKQHPITGILRVFVRRVQGGIELSYACQFKSAIPITARISGVRLLIVIPFDQRRWLLKHLSSRHLRHYRQIAFRSGKRGARSTRTVSGHGLPQSLPRPHSRLSLSEGFGRLGSCSHAVDKVPAKPSDATTPPVTLQSPRRAFQLTIARTEVSQGSEGGG